MGKISRAGGATRAGQTRADVDAPPVLLRGERITILDGAIGLSATPGAIPDLWLARNEAGQLSASQPRNTIASLITTDTALVTSRLNPVSTASGDRVETLPTSPQPGDELVVRKTTYDGNQLKITGNINGLASSAVTTVTPDEALHFTADAASSWWLTGGQLADTDRFARSMITFRSALANRHYSPVKILGLGASTMEGQGATVYGRHFLAMLTARLRERYPVSGVTGGAGFIPCWSNVTGQSGYPLALSGGATQESGERTIGWRSSRIDAAGETVSGSFTGTSFKVIYSQGIASAGSFDISIDGGAATTVSSAGAYDRFHTWTSDALSQASHTVSIVRNTGSNVIHGIFAHNQDETAGFSVYNSGRSGFKLADVQDFLQATVTDAVTAIQPHLILLFWGYNDWHLNVTSAAYKVYMQAHIAAIRAACSSAPSVVIVNGPAVWDTVPTEPWANYQAAHQAVVTADPTVGLWNLALRSPLTDNTLALYENTATPTHPIDKGHSLLADAGVRQLAG